MCCGEAAEKEKESARRTIGSRKREKWFPPFPSSHRPPRAFYFFDYCYFHRRYPAGASAEERARSCNNREAQGGQQDSMVFIKIRLVQLFTALEIKTRKGRAIFTIEETKTTTILRARKKKEKQTTKFTSVATSDLDSGG